MPPAVLMTAIYWPFFTRLELYKIATLIGVRANPPFLMQQVYFLFTSHTFIA